MQNIFNAITCQKEVAMKDKSSYLKTISQTVAQGPFADSWESLQNYKIPQWYQDAKLGIFTHWGVYSVPAFQNEWYPNTMYLKGSKAYHHQVETYGPLTKFGYKDFIPLFKGEHFDAAAWIDLFKKAGAKFVVPVAEHHDGFAMYDCGFSKWSAVEMGPKRDIIAELARAARAAGLIFGLASHRAEHWWFMGGGMEFDSDVRDQKYADFYGPAKRRHDRKTPDIPATDDDPDEAFLNDWLARTCELVDKYEPQIVWFDWWIEHQAFAPYLRKFGAYYYNRAAHWKKGVAINYKFNAYAEGSAVLDIERGQMKAIRPLLWQTDTAVSRNSWSYIRGQDYKQPGDIIGDFMDIISKNGVLLLNIGPRPDGTIPEADRDILLAIGKWLALNGEAVYGTRPWRVFGEGPTEVCEGHATDTKRNAFTSADIRFTGRNNVVYATVLAWPESGNVIIHSLASGSIFMSGEIKKVELLGHGPVTWTRTAGGLSVQMPPQKPCEHAFVLKIS